MFRLNICCCFFFYTKYKNSWRNQYGHRDGCFESTPNQTDENEFQMNWSKKTKFRRSISVEFLVCLLLVAWLCCGCIVIIILDTLVPIKATGSIFWKRCIVNVIVDFIEHFLSGKSNEIVCQGVRTALDRCDEVNTYKNNGVFKIRKPPR